MYERTKWQVALVTIETNAKVGSVGFNYPSSTSRRLKIEGQRYNIANVDSGWLGTRFGLDAAGMHRSGMLIAERLWWRSVLQVVVKLLTVSFGCRLEVPYITVGEEGHQISSDGVSSWLEQSCKDWQAIRMFGFVPDPLAGMHSFDDKNIAVSRLICYLLPLLCFPTLLKQVVGASLGHGDDCELIWAD